jgi:hypothetical protein
MCWVLLGWVAARNEWIRISERRREKVESWMVPNSQAAADWHNEALSLARRRMRPGASISELLQEAAKIQRAEKPKAS